MIVIRKFCRGDLWCNVWKFHLSIKRPTANEWRQKIGGESSERKMILGKGKLQEIDPIEEDGALKLKIR